MQVNRHTGAWTAPEILEGASTITLEADMFAFGMIVIEVGPRALLPLVLEVEGRMVRPISESCIRLLQEGLRSVNSQLRSLIQRL